MKIEDATPQKFVKNYQKSEVIFSDKGKAEPVAVFRVVGLR